MGARIQNLSIQPEYIVSWKQLSNICGDGFSESVKNLQKVNFTLIHKNCINNYCLKIHFK